MKIAGSSMQHYATRVDKVVEPPSVAPHLKSIRMMSTVVLKDHFTVRPREIHPSDEFSIHADFELKHRWLNTCPMHRQAHLGL